MELTRGEAHVFRMAEEAAMAANGRDWFTMPAREQHDWIMMIVKLMIKILDNAEKGRI